MEYFIYNIQQLEIENQTLQGCTQGINNTLSGRIGKVVASHAAVARSSPAEVGLIHTMHVALRWYCPCG